MFLKGASPISTAPGSGEKPFRSGIDGTYALVDKGVQGIAPPGTHVLACMRSPIVIPLGGAPLKGLARTSAKMGRGKGLASARCAAVADPMPSPNPYRFSTCCRLRLAHPNDKKRSDSVDRKRLDFSLAFVKLSEERKFDVHAASIECKYWSIIVL